MTDTGRVPGEGLPENAGGQPGQPLQADGFPPADTGPHDHRMADTSTDYAFLDGADTPGEDDDLLLMPGTQGAWMERQATRPAQSAPGAPPTSDNAVGDGGTAAGDGGHVGGQPQPVPPRRPPHLGPPLPDPTGGVVRSLADRGPAHGPAPTARHAGPPAHTPAGEPTPSDTPWPVAPAQQEVLAPTAEPWQEPQEAAPVGEPQPMAEPSTPERSADARTAGPVAAPPESEPFSVVPAPESTAAPVAEPAPAEPPAVDGPTGRGAGTDRQVPAAAGPASAPATPVAGQPCPPPTGDTGPHRPTPVPSEPVAPADPTGVRTPPAGGDTVLRDEPADVAPSISSSVGPDGTHDGTPADPEPGPDGVPRASGPVPALDDAPSVEEGRPAQREVEPADQPAPVPEPVDEAGQPSNAGAEPGTPGGGAEPAGGAEPEASTGAPEADQPAGPEASAVPDGPAVPDVPVEPLPATTAVPSADAAPVDASVPAAPDLVSPTGPAAQPVVNGSPNAVDTGRPAASAPKEPSTEQQAADRAPADGAAGPKSVTERDSGGAEPSAAIADEAPATDSPVEAGTSSEASAGQRNADAAVADAEGDAAPADPVGTPTAVPEPRVQTATPAADGTPSDAGTPAGAKVTEPDVAVSAIDPAAPPETATEPDGPALPASQPSVGGSTAPESPTEQPDTPGPTASDRDGAEVSGPEPTGEQPVVSEPTGERPAVSEPTEEQPVVSEPAGERPAVSEPAEERPADASGTPSAASEEAEEPEAVAEPPVAVAETDGTADGATEGGPAEATDPAASAPRPVGPAADGYGPAERAAVHRVMRERRDIRNGFRTDPIAHEVLLRVLEAAHTAPSVGHSQPWDFVVIRSEETRRTVHELAMRQREAYAASLPKARAKQFNELKIEAILETPVNIVVTADPTRGGRHTLGRRNQPQMAPYSSALAVENLWLAARAEGLGVGWVSFFDERELVRALDLPDHLEVVAYLCVGYVDEFPEEPELAQAGWSKRRPLAWVVHEESYGRRALPGVGPRDLLPETLQGVRPLDAKALGEAWERQKRMTKPSGALGMLEIISAQLCGLSRQCPPPIPEPAAVAVFAGDHGVHAQRVTSWPQEVTAQMVTNFLDGGAVCNAFAKQVGAEVCVVDVGVSAELPAAPGLLPRKVRPGTDDITAGPAMSRDEVMRAVEVGIETARDLVTAGNKALLTGEMGIANTTASAALISVYTGADPAEVTGRGTGVGDEMLARKVDVVRRAIDRHQPDPSDPVGVLAAVGGLEHAAIVGFLLGGASLRTPVILDGVSAGAAALVARAIAPETLAACIAGHRSAEPGHVAALTKLGLRPLVDLDLRLGEGTGALLALPLVQSAARAMHEVATFDSAGVTEKN